MEKEYRLFIDWQPYDKKTIDDMYNFRVYGMPSSFLLLDRRKTDTYCHFCASILSMIIPGAIRKEGKLGVLDGDYHSWVEVGGYCYDTTWCSMWVKNSYCEKRGVLDEKVVEDDGDFSYARRVVSALGCPELYYAWILDFENDGLDKIPYRTILREHIDRFKKEKDLDNVELDQDKVLSYYNDLQELYSNIQRSINESKNSSK